jgi:hypothetical protein
MLHRHFDYDLDQFKRYLTRQTKFNSKLNIPYKERKKERKKESTGNITNGRYSGMLLRIGVGKSDTSIQDKDQRKVNVSL